MSDTDKERAIAEKIISDLAVKCAKAYGMDATTSTDYPGVGSITWTVREAYEAGRKAGIEDAARLAVARMTYWPSADNNKSQDFRDGIETACSQLAAEFRKLGEKP